MTVLVEGTQVVESVEIHVEVNNSAGIAFAEANGLRGFGDVVLADDNLAVALRPKLRHLAGSDPSPVEVVEAVDEVGARGVLGHAVSSTRDVGASLGSGVDGTFEDFQVLVVGTQCGAPAISQEPRRESACVISGIKVQG